MEQQLKETDTFKNSDGQKIYCKYWYPKDNRRPRAAIFICHGAGEHCQFYQHLATSISNEDFLVFAHDHVGHGLSDGDRVHLNRGSTYIDDVVQHVNMIKQKYPNIPFFTIGHSLGGLIAVKTALDYADIFAGVILIGPALVPDPKLATPFLIFCAKWLASVMPQFQLKAVDPNHLSHDPELVKRYVEDPLVWHGGLKARWGLHLLDMMNDVNERFHQVTFPLLILHGTDDKLCCTSGSKKLYEAARSKNKVLKLFPGAFHQVHNETEGRREESESMIISWIKAIVTSADKGTSG